MSSKYRIQHTLLRFVILLFLFIALVTAQDEGTEPTEANPTTAPSGAEVMSTETAEDSDDEVIELCLNYEFPTEDFVQNDTSKVYTQVETLTSGPFFDNNITKYVTVFGVRVMASEDVEDEKIIHLAKVLAQFLDNDHDGDADHEETVEILRERRSTIFIIKDPSMPQHLLSEDDDVGFPPEFKVCNFAFDFEVADRIKLETQVEVDCDTSAGTEDRSLGLVSDHVIGRSWPMFLTQGMETPEYEMLDKLFEEAVDKEHFDIESAGCPPDALEHCGFVMFSSWAFTSVLGVDKCWCQDAAEWKLCTPDLMKESSPDLFDFLSKRLKNKPDGNYVVEQVTE